ncbi:MAG: tyrosine-type recombinase/integrase, partial [Gammaproteobacteria bacterium]|nr:tyrosine-type recombinase/integrase [Gammaproteobacteria bacterium]
VVSVGWSGKSFSGSRTLQGWEEYKLTPAARRPVVAAVRGFYGWAHESGYINTNPAEYLYYPKSGRKIPVAMSLASAERIMLQCDLDTFIGLRDAAILAVLIGCGPRVGGVCGLDVEDLHWQHDAAGMDRLVIKFKEKGDKERLVPAPIQTALYLQAYLNHEDLVKYDRSLENGHQVLFVSNNNNVPAHERHGEHIRVAPRSVFDRIRKYGEQAGIPSNELHPHAMRHLFGTEMTEDDVNVFVQAELMGHEDTRTTQAYSQLAMRKKAEAIDKASPMRKIRTPVSGIAQQLENNTRKRASTPRKGA